MRCSRRSIPTRRSSSLPPYPRLDVVVAGEQIAGIVPALDRREPPIGLSRIDRGDILRVEHISKRFGQGAREIDRYIQLDGYKAARKALESDIGRSFELVMTDQSLWREQGGAA